ncbi:hypothetical protein NO1_0862 [Candidatus Termititenax aidoneus]|uniref:Uncharacterized protein n=1 Tax=Termititenax aidoneus TaxID=2218524 RepID=A0A388TAY5_TERA1|nr:hypothetical protein NO1_0862 [Candidatus Termititenax aidoneus]
MSEVILRLDDTSDLAKIMQAISPYFQTVSIVGFTDRAKQENSPKIWDGNMDWLGKPWKVDGPFKPLSRDEIYDR